VFQRVLKIGAVIFCALGALFVLGGAAGAALTFAHHGSHAYPLLLWQGDAWMASLVFLIAGLVLLIVGIATLLCIHAKRKKAVRLHADGICYPAEITNAWDNPFISMNFRPAYIVECIYEDNSGAKHTVKSGSLWPDRGWAKGDPINAKVWMLPDNPKIYEVEVTFGGEKKEDASGGG